MDMMLKEEILPARRCLEMQPYEVSDSAKLPMTKKKEYLKLDWNEALIPPSPVVKRKLQEAIESDIINFYPDVTAAELRSKLSCYVGLDTSHIQVFNGSDDALQTICTTFLEDEDTVLLREPTYTQFKAYVQSTGANLLNFNAQSPFSPALDMYHEFLSREKVKIVYIVNPNNPTGLMYDEASICELLQKYPQTLFVIDEAYFEYSGVTFAGLIPRYHNIVITRTFSKAFGLAGLRLGYVLCQPQIISHLFKVRNGKNVNVLAQIAASAALDDIPYMQRYIRCVEETRTWLARGLRKLGLEVYETPANFILVRVSDVEGTIEVLRKENILVRDRSTLAQLGGCIRVSIGLLDQMERFLEVMTKLLCGKRDLVVSEKS